MATGTTRRIAFVQRHYLPDVPTYCELSHGIASDLAQEYGVEVFTTSPSYQGLFDGIEPPAFEVIDDVKVNRLRVPSRLPAMVGFTLAATAKLRSRRNEFDLVMVVSEPPVVLPHTIVRAAGSSTKTIQLLQDIHPEAGAAAGMLENTAVQRTLVAMDGWTARHADRTVVLSDDMAQTYRSRNPQDLRVINNYRLEHASEAPPSGLIDAEKFNVTFAGNVGKFQNLDVLLDAASQFADAPDVRIHIVGSGSELDRIHKRVLDEKLGNVVVHGRLSRNEAQGFMEQSDVGVITLAPEIHHYSYPSKTMAYIEAGCALLGIVEPDSSLAHDINSYSLGEVSTPDGAAVARAILALRKQSGVPASQNGLPFGRRETLDHWRELVGELL